jgi:hypothetical protein
MRIPRAYLCFGLVVTNVRSPANASAQEEPHLSYTSTIAREQVKLNQSIKLTNHRRSLAVKSLPTLMIG